MRRLVLLSALITACGGILPSFGEDPAPPIDPADRDASTTDDAAIGTGPDGAPQSDGGAQPVDATTDDVAAAPSYRVFVSSTVRSGTALKSDIDTNCQSLADGAMLGGKWVAWLSDTTRNASAIVVGNGPWKTVGAGDLVATDRNALLGGTLAHAIDRDQNGVFHNGVSVWTGSSTSGLAIPISHCADWMGTTSDKGRIGSSNATNGDWTDLNTVTCLLTAHVYCFEIPE